MAGTISTLDRNMRKNGQRSYISVRQSTPAARAAASPLPTPYQPGTTCRVGHDLPGLGPAEHPWDGAHAVDAGAGAGPP